MEKCQMIFVGEALSKTEEIMFVSSFITWGITDASFFNKVHLDATVLKFEPFELINKIVIDRASSSTREQDALGMKLTGINAIRVPVFAVELLTQFKRLLAAGETWVEVVVGPEDYAQLVKQWLFQYIEESENCAKDELTIVFVDRHSMLTRSCVDKWYCYK